jgi:hypothetical protein
MTSPPPIPEQQVQFLRNIQRLLSEGLFVASYKFALIHALADLAVLKGDDAGNVLELSTREIATKFIELYWNQSRPFSMGGNSSLILQQNTGRQAAIIGKIAAIQKEVEGSLYRVKQASPTRWNELVTEVDAIVRTMPLWKLQTVGTESLEFLYANVGKGTKIILKPGVSYCLRTFYEFIRDLIEGAWVRFVQRVNANNLGNATDLGSFLFDTQRSNLETYRPILLDVQKGICLYCKRTIRDKSQVDHFVPWSRFPTDLGFNFVLAHDKCNNSKSDFLAAENHLESWMMRNHEHQTELHQRLVESGLPSDFGAAIQIARWMYQQTEKSNGQVWVIDKVLKHLDPSWSRYFAA